MVVRQADLPESVRGKPSRNPPPSLDEIMEGEDRIKLQIEDLSNGIYFVVLDGKVFERVTLREFGVLK